MQPLELNDEAWEKTTQQANGRFIEVITEKAPALGAPGEGVVEMWATWSFWGGSTVISAEIDFRKVDGKWKIPGGKS